ATNAFNRKGRKGAAKDASKSKRRGHREGHAEIAEKRETQFPESVDVDNRPREPALVSFRLQKMVRLAREPRCLPEVHPGSQHYQHHREDPQRRIAHSGFLGHGVILPRRIVSAKYSIGPDGPGTKVVFSRFRAVRMSLV